MNYALECYVEQNLGADRTVTERNYVDWMRIGDAGRRMFAGRMFDVDGCFGKGLNVGGKVSDAGW